MNVHSSFILQERYITEQPRTGSLHIGTEVTGSSIDDPISAICAPQLSEYAAGSAFAFVLALGHAWKRSNIRLLDGIN